MGTDQCKLVLAACDRYWGHQNHQPASVAGNPQESFDYFAKFGGSRTNNSGRSSCMAPLTPLRLSTGKSKDTVRDQALKIFPPILEWAALEGGGCCLEPLARRETDLVNIVAEVVETVDQVASLSFRKMIDTSAAATEVETVRTLIDTWLTTGKIEQIQVNNRIYPGGLPGLGPVHAYFLALGRNVYDGIVAE